MTYPIPANEQKRLEALRRYHILDSEAEDSFDHLTSLAAYIFGTPTAFVTFIDEDRQWMKSRHGSDVCETSREVAFCAHTILSNRVMVVNDARVHPDFKDNPLVTGDAQIRFYAGAPLMDEDDLGLGSLCVVDSTPHQVSDEQVAALRKLADLAIRMLRTRRVLDDLAQVSRELKVLQGLLPICANCKSIRTDTGDWHELERYVRDHSEATFTHSICPDCTRKLYPELHQDG